MFYNLLPEGDLGYNYEIYDSEPHVFIMSPLVYYLFMTMLLFNINLFELGLK